MNRTITYAQNREDIILSGFFTEIKRGFYVDIGANEPTLDSVTKYFYDKGWSGINVEPIPVLYEKLKEERPRDINVNLGIGDKKGTAILRYYPHGDGLSTMSDKMAKSYEERPTQSTLKVDKITVPVVTLNDLFEKYAKNKTINFIKIDVEGYEEAVIKGNDWKRYRPQIICIEANHVFDDWKSILHKSKYSIVFFDGLNEYYAAEEFKKTADKFSYVQTIIGGAPIPYDVAKVLGKYEEQSSDFKYNLQQYELRIKQLEVEADNPKTMKQALVIFMRSTHYKILKLINLLKPVIALEVQFNEYNKDTKKLYKVIHEYDLQNEEVFNAQFSLRMLPYIFMIKAYKLFISIGKKLERLTGRILRRIKR